jgi:putative transposase
VTDLIVRGWKGRLYPTREQAARLNQWCGSLRFLWNRLLEREKAEYAATGKFLWCKGLQPLAVGMKRDANTAWLADLPAHAVLDTVARLDGALRRMGKERKAGRTCGFPKPKKKFVHESGIYCVGQATEIGAREAQVPKLGRVRLRGGDLPQGRLLSARITRDGDRWMLSAQVECARPEPLAATSLRLGVDAGLSKLVTPFDGATFDEVDPPKPLRKALKRLRRAQRMFSRRKKGSARRRVAARKVAAIHRRVRQVRANALHQLSHRLTSKADVLVVETLDVRAMSRALRLGRSVADAALGALLRQIATKADWRGRALVEADRWYPSTKTCSACGVKHPMPLRVRTLRCPCGLGMDRDRNAAVNLYWYPEERENRGREAPTRVEIGGQAEPLMGLPVPVVETRMLVRVDHVFDHECQ